ncbi:unnamed protein product, partial [Effrenium voratum]
MPETKVAKKARLMEMAQQKKDGQEVKTKKPQVLKYGLNHVTTLVENKMAKLVIIAHDVEPIELVCWLPALCRKKDVPYCIIKGKSRLGQLIHQKTCACVAITSVKPEDEKELNNLVGNFKAQFNDNVEVKRRWGGGIMGIKSQHVTQRRERAIQAEKAKKLGLQIAYGERAERASGVRAERKARTEVCQETLGAKDGKRSALGHPENVEEGNSFEEETRGRLEFIETLDKSGVLQKGLGRPCIPGGLQAPRSYRLGGDIQPKRDLTRFVKWPKYINLQRQKRIMLMRLKVPPAINQFSMTIDKNQ